MTRGSPDEEWANVLDKFYVNCSSHKGAVTLNYLLSLPSG
ncbi:hypothetical protein PORCAN_471 [Porphyromonas crevioricanis JCM 13913]|nr:hypothetical protein PORCAN_471 [Porphyromonas crevioricanis JCM 13913]